MKLPPHTPEQVLKELAAKPDIRKRIARGWMLVGGLLTQFMGTMAVAHYVYGVPIQNGNTGAEETPAEALTMFLMIGGGGLLFLVMGVLLHGWKSRPFNDL